MGDIDFGTHPGLPWPAFEALQHVVGENAHEQENHDVAARAIRRHQPVPDHGRDSDEGCLAPEGCGAHGMGARPPVCKTCRDNAGGPIEAPCDDLVDWGAFYGIDFT